MLAPFLSLVFVITPLFVGFLLPCPFAPKRINQALNVATFLLLFLIGVMVASTPNTPALTDILEMTAVLTALTFFVPCVLCAILLKPIKSQRSDKTGAGLGGFWSTGAALGLGILCGVWGLDVPDMGVNIALAIMLYLTSAALLNEGVCLRDALTNKTGVAIAGVFVLGTSLAGTVFAWIYELPTAQGLAMASGFGWYSLSGLMMTKAYGSLIGSVVLMCDLVREFLAFVFIPLVIRKHAIGAISMSGAPGLDILLPSIIASGGRHLAPITISFALMVNLSAPVLMTLFIALG